jgi:putative flavoprotein involved in K+ transport
MQWTDTIIVGAGQAGLAMSRCLAHHGIGHVVLERGRIAQRWRTERWDSLRLLSPNWMSRLPDWSYCGEDPDGFMTVAEFAQYLEDYGRDLQMPVLEGAAVRSVRRAPGGYRVDTTRGSWQARAVIIATGHCDVPVIPAFAGKLSGCVEQVTTSTYRNPAQLPAGGVLVVGASASGVQIAEEIQRAGRRVTISVGRHTRLPRIYRGKDIWYWLERIGVLDESAASVRDLRRSRAEPSFQLVGSLDRHTLDLGVLRAAGVQITGRTVDADGPVLQLLDDVAETTASAQQALERLLARIDAVTGSKDLPPEPDAARSVRLSSGPVSLNLKSENICTVVWAIGYRRDYSWLHVPVLDAAGEIIHDGGVTPSPGLFVIGLRFMRRRKSNFIDGVRADAEELAEMIRCHLITTTPYAAA